MILITSDSVSFHFFTKGNQNKIRSHFCLLHCLIGSYSLIPFFLFRSSYFILPISFFYFARPISFVLLRSSYFILPISSYFILPISFFLLHSSYFVLPTLPIFSLHAPFTYANHFLPLIFTFFPFSL